MTIPIKFIANLCSSRSLFHDSAVIMTRMWANTQRDGCPAECRWRPLFDAAKFGSRPLLDAVQ